MKVRFVDGVDPKSVLWFSTAASELAAVNLCVWSILGNPGLRAHALSQSGRSGPVRNGLSKRCRNDVDDGKNVDFSTAIAPISTKFCF